MSHTNQSTYKETTLSKPTLTLIIAALITSPAMFAGCSSAQHQPAQLSEKTPVNYSKAETPDLQTMIAPSTNTANITNSTTTTQTSATTATLLQPEDNTTNSNLIAKIEEMTEGSATGLEHPAKTTFKFGFNKQELADEAVDIIAQHGRFLSQHPEKKVQVHGHADAQGSPVYNQYLSKQRADYVAELLKQQGATESQIEVMSWGSEKPITGATHRQDHRRVEIIYEETLMVQAPADENAIF
ncbi:MAG: hypothetical protein CSA49_00370 [Gammaproteobacteria bacterium]|nr:MAG: hypothetical protein CSA49_00370 [Gammaproteobacteria bacterium]